MCRPETGAILTAFESIDIVVNVCVQHHGNDSPSEEDGRNRQDIG